MKSSDQNMINQHNTLFLFVVYIICGVLHEAAHISVASLYYSQSEFGVSPTSVVLLQAIFGRYSVIQLSEKEHHDIIRHAGWIFSVLLAIVCHLIHNYKRTTKNDNDDKGSSILGNIAMVAYITAFEAIVTDLLQLTPMHIVTQNDSIICFCGNFGILLLNPSWLSIDGGRTALDVLEKMVNVTMMRGAQSGGVVTFEPDSYSKKHPSSSSTPPPLHGVRSRVVNAKRSDLSKRVRHKVVKDNTERLTGNLRGYNKSEYNINNGGGKLVRGFFGHTRFATSSKASFEGTHPHRWSERRMLNNVYTFGSSSSSMSSCRPRRIGVENYITHNGDFEFFKVNGKYYDVEVVQQWLETVLDTRMPATVDSAAIAGVIDLLRTQGSFALSVRYALCLTLSSSKVEEDPAVSYPSMKEYEEIAKTFENALNEQLEINECENKNVNGLEYISSCEEKRAELAGTVVKSLLTNLEVLPTGKKTNVLGESSRGKCTAMGRLGKFISSDEEDTDLSNFVQAVVDAFFDNDLLHSTRLFLNDAKGSFGLMITSSLDAHRQTCFAARGQTLSIAFYPKKGLICYASEQAAVKAGLNYDNPGGDIVQGITREADNATRLDLDDLGGEIVLLDWGFAGDSEPAVSPPNRNLMVNKLMNNCVNVVLLQQSDTFKPISKRLTLLENNEFIKPLSDDCTDPVLNDIQDIPRICANIQNDWREVGLNRMTAWNLARCIQTRMRAHADGNIKCHGNTVDILVTGCEVSLWVAEQFCSDLQKSFPQLFVKSVSSNKLLGLFGQELAMPCTGFPDSAKTLDLKDPIVIIVSHSGGTFGPLACSNLLQSFSSSIFAVTSEWDTQVGKQLRAMYSDDFLSSRIFSTEVGVRPAEPCSVSVAATHQLLTNIYGHIAITIISDPAYSKAAGSVVRERDLQILERCNQEGIKALEEIVGVDRHGDEIHKKRSKTEDELRAAGNLWSDHILENVKAYIMSFVYIFVTVVSGYPLVSGVVYACGLREDLEPGDKLFYFLRFLDACIYFWLPQLNVIILRLIQGRNLRHRMVARTVVIGDCPWVAQAAEAFLSKIFAVSYSIAGLNVLSGNPSDHLVHRHTHRVVRGTLLVCGRPDGRLPALTSLEASTCLSVNQASSIQSLSGTCESISIGHNRSKLPLSHKAIYLKSHRPMFLSEKILDNIDHQEDLVRQRKEKLKEEKDRQQKRISLFRTASYIMETVRFRGDGGNSFLELSLSRSRQAKTTRSSASLLGAYVNLERDARKKRSQSKDVVEQAARVSNVISSMIKERQGVENTRRVYNQIDIDGDGVISLQEFVNAYQKIDNNISKDHLTRLFYEADTDDNGTLSFDEFMKVSQLPNLLAELGTKNRDSRGLVQLQASKEKYLKVRDTGRYPSLLTHLLPALTSVTISLSSIIICDNAHDSGEEIRKHSQPQVSSMAMSQSQHFAMELYESRIASLQRFVAMTVMFHQMGLRVQQFFARISFGLLAYRMDRTHSIMRIATTASPVSGADVRERMEELRLILKIERSVQLIQRVWRKWRSNAK